MDPNVAPLPEEHAVLTDVMKNMQLELRAQSVTQQIREFDGQNSRKFKEWLRDIERAAAVVEADDERYRAFCLMTLKGPASDFLGRILRQRPQIPWDVLKTQLREQFSDTGDALIAKQKLLRTAQYKDESIQNFAERLFGLAEEAYTGDELNSHIVQSQLVEVLTAGLRDDRIARKLLRDRPRDLSQAVRMAMTEFQTGKCFELCRRAEEAMDVNQVTSQGTALRDLSHDISSLREELKVLAAEVRRPQSLPQSYAQSYPQSYQQNYTQSGTQNARQEPRFEQPAPGSMRKPPQGANRYEWTADNKPICCYCKKIGHKYRECKSRKRAENKSNLN